MRVKRMRRAAVAAALVAALFLALPAEGAGLGRGAAGDPGLFERAWSWLAGWLAPAGGSPRDGAQSPGGWRRAVGADGIHIDPNGNTTTVSCPPGGCVETHG